MSDNRNAESSFTKSITGYSIHKSIILEESYGEFDVYTATINYKLVYVHERQVSAIAANTEWTDCASKKFNTEEDAKKWLKEKGVSL